MALPNIRFTSRLDAGPQHRLRRSPGTALGVKSGAGKSPVPSSSKSSKSSSVCARSQAHRGVHVFTDSNRAVESMSSSSSMSSLPGMAITNP
jgi:hypothetical protein